MGEELGEKSRLAVFLWASLNLEWDNNALLNSWRHMKGEQHPFAHNAWQARHYRPLGRNQPEADVSPFIVKTESPVVDFDASNS